MLNNFSANAISWEISEQENRKVNVCGVCHEVFEAGSLRLRPTGTKKTRLCHLTCAKNLVRELADLSNFASLGQATQQRVTRELSIALSRPLAPGDADVVDIGDTHKREIVARAELDYKLRNVDRLDDIAWDDIQCCPVTIRKLPEHWKCSVAEAKHAVVVSILGLLIQNDYGNCFFSVMSSCCIGRSAQEEAKEDKVMHPSTHCSRKGSVAGGLVIGSL